MSFSQWVHLDVDRIVKITELAMLLRLRDRDSDVWVPISQISEPDDYDENDTDATVSVTEWFATKEGLKVT